MKKEVQQKINQLAKELKESNKEETLKKIKTTLESNGFSERSLTKYYSETKKLFKEYTKDQEFLKEIRPSPELTERIINLNKTVRDNRPMKVINKDFLLKVKSMKNNKGQSKSNTINRLLIYLIFVSGRRVSEIIEGTFYTKKNNKDIFFKGIKKKKGGKDRDTEFELKLLTSKSSFIKCYKLFKELTKGKTTKSLTITVNNYIKRNFGESFTSHTFRGVYGNYLFKFFNPDNLVINQYLRKVLKHDVIETSLNYTAYKIDIDKPIKGM